MKLRLLKQFQINVMNQNNLSGFHKSIFFLLKNYRVTRINTFCYKMFVIGGSQNNYFSIESHFFKTVPRFIPLSFWKKKKKEINHGSLGVAGKKYGKIRVAENSKC